MPSIFRWAKEMYDCESSELSLKNWIWDFRDCRLTGDDSGIANLPSNCSRGWQNSVARRSIG